MLATKRITLETLDSSNEEQLDEFIAQVMEEGMKKVRAETADLQARGLMDSEGKIISKELPPDMRPGSGLDFGG
jgi:hypothetical protein